MYKAKRHPYSTGLIIVWSEYDLTAWYFSDDQLEQMKAAVAFLEAERARSEV